LKTYAVKEIFKTLQGEGFHSGRPAVFCRFSGCNGWSGLERDRDKGPFACSAWCDTQFVGTDGTRGGKYDAVGLARTIAELWDSPVRPRFVVLTGGEPMLQVDDWLIDVLHRWECEIAIETNGTREVPKTIDWITVSPKAGAPLIQTSGHELKVVRPQPGLDLDVLVKLPFKHRFLSPMDGPDREASTTAAIEDCLADPRWRLSVQVHKFIKVR
jgi:7-carboxy-7-deazaguanine synthase